MAIRNIGVNPERVVRAGDGPGVLVNRDFTNFLWIGPNSSIVGGNPNIVSILDALVGIPVSGESDIWACSPSNAYTIQTDFMPRAHSWQPSPAQQATQIASLGLALDTSVQGVKTTLGTPAQTADIQGLPGGIASSGVALDTSVKNLPGGIATSGVPLLGYANNLYNVGNIGIAAGATYYSTVFTLNQISYDVQVNLNVDAGSATPFALVTFTWIDSASDIAIQITSWVVGAGSGSPNGSLGPQCYSAGSGPVRADTLKVSIRNLDPSYAMTAGLVLGQNSRFTTRDDIRTINGLSNVPGYSLGYNDITVGILTYTDPTIGAGNTIYRLLPLYSGEVQIQAQAASSESCDVTVSPIDPGLTHTGNVYNFSLNAGANLNTTVILPHTHCQVAIKNTGSASASFGFGAYLS